MSYDLGLRCSICGSIISDDNPDGIGFGCRQNVVRPAEIAAAKELNPNFNLETWAFKVNAYRNEFLKVFEGRKFRSEFKKSFFESIKKSEKVSKKQLEIIKNMLEWEINLPEFEENLKKEEINFFNSLILKEKLKEEYKNIYLKYIEIFKKQYLSKKDNNEDIENK